MRITCPGCEAVYEVADVQVLPGRSVCCARCNQEWQPSGAVAPPPPVAAVRAARAALRPSVAKAPVPPAQTNDPAARPTSRPSRAPAWEIGWAASLLLLAGLLAGASHWSGPIMHGWPPSTRLYAALGATPSGHE